MVKARSVDVSLKSKQVYELITNDLEKHGLNIVDMVEISRYEKNHAAIAISN